MRWVVELPAPSGGTAATVTVDADSWAGALTHARGGSPIKKFRCEFDADNVVRVLDLSNREWYTIRPIRAVAAEAASAPVVVAPTAPVVAPDDAPQAPVPQPFALARDEEPSQPEPPAVEASPSPEPEASPSSAPQAPSGAAPTPQASETSAAKAEADPSGVEAASPARPPSTATFVGVAPAFGEESRLVAVDESGEHQALPGGLAPPTLLFQRDQDPSESNPLAYRERVFVVPAGTAVADAETVARHALVALRRSLATRPRGRYVVVAVFDHSFTTRPLRPALVELRWRDWRGDVEVTHPSPAPLNGATHADASGSVDVSVVVAASASVPEDAPAPTESPAPVSPDATSSEAQGAFVAAAIEAPAAEPSPEVPASVRETSVTSPIAEPEAPAVEAARPVVEPEAPAVEAARPVVEPEAPAVEAARPVAEPEAPAVEAARPVAEPEVPAVEATKPAVEPVAVAALEASVATLPPPGVTSSTSEPTVVVEPATVPAETAEASTVVSEPTPSGEQPDAPRSEPATSVAAGSPEVTPAPSPEAAAVEAPGPRRAARTIARRMRGKDLLSELFDALMDLSHLESADAGCKQVVQILQEHVQCDLAAVSLYDIDRDEFVVNAAFGAEGVVGRRERAKVGVASTVVKRKAGVTLASCGADDVVHDDLREGGGAFAPAMFRDRLFALVRVHRVAGAEAFETDEADALSYVAAQLGEFLSTQSKRAAAAEFAPEPRRSQAPPRR